MEARAAAPVAAAAAAPFAAAAAAAPSAAPTAAVAAGVIRLPGYSAWLEDGRPKPLKVGVSALVLHQVPAPPPPLLCAVASLNSALCALKAVGCRRHPLL